MDFLALHRGDAPLLLPNAWDAGSARLLERSGFAAVATTSAAFAWTLGRDDGEVALEELVAHVRSLAGAVRIPVAVDAERCFDDPAATVAALAEAGAAGVSIEDWDPAAGALDAVDAAAARVAAAAGAARDAGVVVTGRCELLLHGGDDLDEVIARLAAYAAAGADVLFAPGLRHLDAIRRVVGAVDRPVNVLLLPGGPSVAELAAAGVRRISTGPFLASAAYAAGLAVARALRDEPEGAPFAAPLLAPQDREAFAGS